MEVLQLGAELLRLHVCSLAARGKAHTLQLVAEERERRAASSAFGALVRVTQLGYREGSLLK